jgi:hypothetical protein
MRLRLKLTTPFFVTILVLGALLIFLTQEVLAGWGTLPGEGEKQGAVYLIQGHGDLPEDGKDCLDLDGPRDNKSDKSANPSRGRKRKAPCDRDDYRRIDFSRPCGKAWSG